jgi:hypothetical protein
MQPEALLHVAQQGLFGLVQADPHEIALGGFRAARLGKVDIGDPAPTLIGRAIDHAHGRPPLALLA